MSSPVNPAAKLSSEQWGSLYETLKNEPFKKTVMVFTRIYKPSPELELAHDLFVQFAILQEFVLPAGFNSKDEVADAFYTLFSERKVLQLSYPYIAKVVAEKQWKTAGERVRSIEKDLQAVRGKISSLKAEAHPHFDFNLPLQESYGDRQKKAFDQMMELERKVLSAQDRGEDAESHPNHAAYLALVADSKKGDDQYFQTTDELQALEIEIVREEALFKRSLAAARQAERSLEVQMVRARSIADVAKATFQAALIEFENFSKTKS